VFVNVSDPVSTGLVSSIARPGGNVTGFTNYEFSMGGKWLEILKEISPSITRVAVIYNPDNPVMQGNLNSIEIAGPKLGIQVTARPGRNPEDFERAIGGWGSEANGGLLVLLDFLTLAHRDLIIASAAHHRLPAGYSLRVFAANGGLFSYGVDAKDLFHRGAAYVDQILKGVKPADPDALEPFRKARDFRPVLGYALGRCGSLGIRHRRRLRHRHKIKGRPAIPEAHWAGVRRFPKLRAYNAAERITGRAGTGVGMPLRIAAGPKPKQLSAKLGGKHNLSIGRRRPELDSYS
jgi:hypothetical protein